MTRAALEPRVSTVAHGQDVELQLDGLRQVASQRGWAHTEFVDRGIPGARTSAPPWTRSW